MNRGNNTITSEQIETFYDRLNTIIILFINNIIKYYTTPLADYVVYQSNYPELIKIGGDRFKDIVAQLFWGKYKKNFEFKYLQFIIDNIKHNYTGVKEPKTIYNRIFHDKEKNEITYLLKEDNTSVKIDPLGFQVMNNTEHIFAEETGSIPQALPNRGVSMEEFHRAINHVISINDFDKLCLIKIFIVSCFLDIQIPHLYLMGASGSSKSYLSKTIRKIVSPNRILLNSTFTKDELNRVLFNSSRIVALNNISEIDQNLNNLLCNIFDVSAGTIVKKLYTNTEKVIIPLDAKIIMSSTKMTITNYELLQRILMIRMDRIENPIDEDVLNQRFSSSIETILGGICTILSKVLEKAIENQSRPFVTTERLVSFEFWGSIISEAMMIPKETFLRIFRKIRLEGVSAFCDNFQEVMLIARYLDDHDELRGTAEQIMTTLKDMDDAEEETLVTNPATFSRKLTEYAEVLAKLEIEVKKHRGKNRNLIITKIKTQEKDDYVDKSVIPRLSSDNEKNRKNTDVSSKSGVLPQSDGVENVQNVISPVAKNQIPSFIEGLDVSVEPQTVKNLFSDEEEVN